MEYKELIKERYSVRSLDGTKVVEEEKINAILEAAQVAPDTPRTPTSEAAPHARNRIDEVMLGDADSNGSVNINDVTAIQRHVAEFEALEDLQAKAADVNGDGSITIEDATILQQYLAEYELSYPINQSIRADYSQCQDGI